MNVNYHSYFVTHLQPLFNVRTEQVIQHLRHLQLLKNACVCASCGGAMSQTRRKRRLDGHIWYVCMYVWYTHVTYAQTPSSLGMLPRCPQMVLQKEPKTFDFLCKSNQVGILGAYSFSSGLQEHVYRSLFFMTGIRGLPLVFCAKIFYQTATKNKVWHTNLS